MQRHRRCGRIQDLAGKISQGVAKEGGFLGIGGLPVSDAERATLAKISSALKIST